MPTTVCEACGASNPADATFCQTCHAFIGWDRTAVQPEYVDRPGAPTSTTPGPDEASIETRFIPKVPTAEQGAGRRSDRDQVSDHGRSRDHDHEQRIVDRSVDSSQVLAVRVEQDRVTVPVSGAPAEIVLLVANRSDIVDGYEVDVGGAPGWLRVESSTVRLLPGTEEGLAVRFRIESEVLVAAGEGIVRLRVRSQAQPPAHVIVPVVVVVPVVDVPVQVRAEPSVVRIRDVEIGRFVVVVDNSGSNRSARVRLSGTDPELAVGFHFDPEVVDVGPGESARVRAVTTSHRPDPGQDISRTVTVSAAEGTRRATTTVTLLQSTTAVVEDPMVDLVAAPTLVRVRDGEAASVRVTIDNRSGRNRASVRLTANDPEGVVRVRWSMTEAQVAPGGTTDIDLQLVGPAPEAGTEITRTVTLTASDGRRVARTQLTMVHSASASPMTTLAVQLDPSVLRLGNGRRGTATVIVDNRGGGSPARVWLQGDDPENVVSFRFEPAELVVGPGQWLSSRVSVAAPRPPGGREVSRPLTIAATDGRTSVSVDGTIIQSAGDRRPWARVVLTLLGGLAMILGAMLSLRRVGTEDSFDISVDVVARLFNAQVNLFGLEQLITFGLVIVVLAGLMMFGLTGRSGRLTRFSALLAVLLTVALLITIGIAGRSAMPGTGAITIVLGAVLGYVGGLLARR